MSTWICYSRSRVLTVRFRGVFICIGFSIWTAPQYHEWMKSSYGKGKSWRVSNRRNPMCNKSQEILPALIHKAWGIHGIEYLRESLCGIHLISPLLDSFLLKKNRTYAISTHGVFSGEKSLSFSLYLSTGREAPSALAREALCSQRAMIIRGSIFSIDDLRSSPHVTKRISISPRKSISSGGESILAEVIYAPIFPSIWKR